MCVYTPYGTLSHNGCRKVTNSQLRILYHVYALASPSTKITLPISRTSYMILVVLSATYKFLMIVTTNRLTKFVVNVIWQFWLRPEPCRLILVHALSTISSPDIFSNLLLWFTVPLHSSHFFCVISSHQAPARNVVATIKVD